MERIMVPTLLVKGGESQLVAPEKIERMSSIPGFEVIIIPGASHIVPQDKPSSSRTRARLSSIPETKLLTHFLDSMRKWM